MNFAAIAERSRERGGGPFSGGGGSSNGGISGNVGSLVGMVKNMPSGVAGLIGQTGESLLGFGRLGYDVARGEDFSEDYGTNLQEYFPVLESMRASFANTGRNLSDPGRYVDAWNEGQGLTTAIEDVGNLAIVAGAASKAATAAGATRTGAALGRASVLGDQFGAAPAKVWTAGPAALNRTVGRLTGATLSERAIPRITGYLNRPEAGNVTRAIARTVDPQVREARRGLSESGVRVAEAQAAPLESMALQFRDANPDLLNAAVVSRNQFYERIGRQIKDLPEAQFDALIESTFGDGLSPAAARIAIDAAEGRLTGKDLDTFNAAREAADQIRQHGDDLTFAREGETPDEFIARTGRTEGPASPEQLGSTPMQGVLDSDRRLVRDRGVVQRLADRDLPKLAERAERLRVQADARKALDRPIVEPPAQGEILRRGRQQGRTQAALRQSRATVTRLRRDLDRAIDDFVRADIDDAARLADLAGAAGKSTDAYNAALDAYNAALREVGIATSVRPTSNRPAAAVNQRIARLVNEIQAAEDLGRPTTALREQLAEARREYALSRDAVGGEVDAPSRVQSDRRLGAAQAKLTAAQREAATAQRRLDTAALRSGLTPKSLVSALEKAQQRLADAEAGVSSLGRELDAQMGFNAPERTPTLRGTFSRGEATGRFDQRARIAENELRKTQRRIENLNARIAKRTEALTAPTGAATPKRWRQVAAESDRASRVLLDMAEELNDPRLASQLTKIADEIPKTIADLEAAGVDPAYLIGGYLPERARKSLRQQNTNLPRIGRTTSSRQAKAMQTDYRFADQAVHEAAAARRQMANVVALEFVDTYGRKAADVIDGAKGLRGRALAKAMRDEGYVAFNPKGIFNTLDDTAVKPDTVFLPRNLHDALAYTLQTANVGGPTAALLRLNQSWKNALLPISPSWYIGNTFGNALMAMVGSGMDPLTYTKHMVEGIRQLRRDGGVIAAMREGVGPSTSPRRLRTAGLTYAESGALDPNQALKRPRTRGGRAYGKFATGAYNVNEFLDNLNKNAVYLHELERARTNPTVMSRLATDGLDPEQYAIREALRVMGDFSKMAPWERKAVAVMPFYRWARHITQLTVRLPIEHPMRVAWMLKLPELFGEDQSDLPEWLQGSIRMGDWVLPSNFLNPFGDVAGGTGPLGLGGALADPDSFARSLSPFIKMPVAALTGMDLSSGLGADVTMPTSSRRIDPNTGRPTTTPLIDLLGDGGVNLSGLANYSVNQLPVSRNIRDLIAGDYPRYDTGERIPNLRPRQQFYQGPARLSQLVGLPEPMHASDVAAASARLRRTGD